MIGIQRISINFFIMFVMCLVVLLVNGITYAADGKYPIKVAIIEKDQATYDTPKNTLAAMCSSSIRDDLEWYYETLTEETAMEDKKAFQDAGIDPRKESEVFKKYFKEAYIIDKHIYGHSIILVVDIHTTNGTIFTLPYTFVKEHNKWKMTNKFASDEDLWEYLDYIKPEEIISSTTKIRPNRWNLNWYNLIKEHLDERKWIRRFAERVCILCMIDNLKDNEGNSFSVEEIVQETLLLNYLVHPQPWKFEQGGKIALIFDLRKGRDLNKMQGFEDWHNRSKFSKKYKGSVMLIKFNKLKAMETLSEMIPGEEYDIIVSGGLKDGKRFKGSAKITITGWKAQHRKNWKDPGWLNADKDTDNWWNKEKAFEGWGEKTRENHKR